MTDVKKALVFTLLVAGLASTVGCRFEWLGGDENLKDMVVLSTSPADRQTNVSSTTQIIIRFSVQPDPEFVVPNQAEPWKVSQIILVNQSNSLVPISFSFNGEYLTLTPQSPLAPQSTYGVAVRPGTRDIYGNNITTPYAFTFSTGSTLTAIPNWPPFTIGTPTGGGALPGTFTLTGMLNVAGGQHEAILLNDGKVLICGGISTPGSAPFRRAEIYDPTTQTWTLSQGNNGQGMFFVRVEHSILKLLNGHILVTGGFDNSSVWDSVEEYDPLQDKFALHQTVMQRPRYWHTSALLGNGNPVVIGGVGPGGIINDMEILDLKTGAWITCQSTIGGTVVVAGFGTGVFRGCYAHETLVLPDGAIFSCGGYLAGTLDLATLYWPSPGDGTQGTALFTGSHMTCHRDRHTATKITTGYGQGIVVVIGGERDDYTFAPICINTAEVYDHNLTAPVASMNGTQGTWAPVGMSMSEKRCNHTANILHTGKILVVGGYRFVGVSPTRTAELFDPFGQGVNLNAPWSGIDLTGNFDWTRNPQGIQTFVPNLFTGVAIHSATTLRDGRVLIAGGNDEIMGIPIPLSLSWLYYP